MNTKCEADRYLDRRSDYLLIVFRVAKSRSENGLGIHPVFYLFGLVGK